MFDTVTLCRPMPEYGLQSGEVGAVVDFLSQPEPAVMIEFCNVDGSTKASVFMRNDDFRNRFKGFPSI
ncbi:MAG: DUF4926 domain-containing protein [Betaproteobacteria bacterium]|nr:DUF4926 domain-containing protein [Betaproteobacteria bacterium]